MKRTFWQKAFWLALIGLLIGMPGIAAVASDASFDKFRKKQRIEENGRKQELAGFGAYKKRVNNSFSSYKESVAEEFAQYKKKILEKWETAETSTQTRWVEYSDAFDVRRIVDFKKGFIELDMLFHENTALEAIDAAIDEKLADLVLQDYETAYERDHLAQNIEAAITKSGVKAKTGDVGRQPVLTNVLTGTDTPTKKQVDRAVSGLKKDSAITARPSKTVADKVVISCRAPLPPGTIRKKALAYKPDIKTHANERNLNPALVFAVIHTESAFNPMARSHVPAFGLMQIVPESAGKDVTAMLYGEPVLLSPSYLYDGRRNINIGTSYLYLLFNRYLKSVESPKSRMYCAIAAYNTGSGNVARAFTGNMRIDEAARIINRMSPDAVYLHLLENLPYRETRNYLEKVVRRMNVYAEL